MKPHPILSLLVALSVLPIPLLSGQADAGFDPLARSAYWIADVETEDLVFFYEMGLEIAGRRGTEVRAYLEPGQVLKLKEMGYSLEERPSLVTTHPALAADYHTFAELTAELQAIEGANPTICKLFNIGNSTQGRALWFMKISDNVDQEEDEPEFKYISSMHGDEPVGMELCLNLIHLLTEDYGVDPQVTDLVNETEIWIMPLMNPDGYTAHSRYNAQGVDLNRDFPDRVVDPDNTPAGRATETQHIMNWAFEHASVLSANFHTGELVVNYPYDSDPDPWTPYSATPDDDLFIAQSLTYSSLNTPMYNSPWFSQGITNGIAWYLVYGGMQDWNYVWMGCNEVTIEVSGSSWPSYSQIPGLWDDNRDSMLAYMAWCQKGVRGIVSNSVTGQPLNAVVTVVGIDHQVFTDPDVGDYHRMLLPGTYTLRFSSPGFVDAEVLSVQVGSGAAVRVDVALDPVGPLIADATTISARFGGSADFSLMAGSGNAGRYYLLLGGISGTVPGLPLPGGMSVLPLNWDSFTDLVVAKLNTPTFQNFLGLLDGQGLAAARLGLDPLMPKHVGKVMQYAFLLDAPFNFVSNAFAIEIVP